jgi:hypothetical protein
MPRVAWNAVLGTRFFGRCIALSNSDAVCGSNYRCGLLQRIIPGIEQQLQIFIFRFGNYLIRFGQVYSKMQKNGYAPLRWHHR